MHNNVNTPMPLCRYPDPAVQVLSPAFEKYHLVLAAVERIASGSRWRCAPPRPAPGGISRRRG